MCRFKVLTTRVFARPPLIATYIHIYICSFGKGNLLVRFREALRWSERWRKYRPTWAEWLCSKCLAISRALFFKYYDRSDSVCMWAAWRSWQISGWGSPAQGRVEQRLNSAQSQYVDVYNKRFQSERSAHGSDSAFSPSCLRSSSSQILNLLCRLLLLLYTTVNNVLL